MLVILLSLLLLISHLPHPTRVSATLPQGCKQSVNERETLIDEAVKNHYLVRRVEFLQIPHTPDAVLRRKLLLNEGDVFTRARLLNSLLRVSRLRRYVAPVKLSDVVVRLDRANQAIDFEICFKEKRNRSRQLK